MPSEAAWCRFKSSGPTSQDDRTFDEAQAHHLTPRSPSRTTSWMTGTPSAPGPRAGPCSRCALRNTRFRPGVNRRETGQPARWLGACEKSCGMSRAPHRHLATTRVGRLGLVRRPCGRARAGRRRDHVDAADAGRLRCGMPSARAAMAPVQVQDFAFADTVFANELFDDAAAAAERPHLRAGPDGQHPLRDSARLPAPDARRRRRPADPPPRALRARAARVSGAP